MKTQQACLLNLVEIRDNIRKLETFLRHHEAYCELTDIHDEILNLHSDVEQMIKSHLP